MMELPRIYFNLYHIVGTVPNEAMKVYRNIASNNLRLIYIY
jgi:hypothetical protein